MVALFKISTHILTKRMTIFFFAFSLLLTFQLTSSRRGWQHHLLPQTVNTYFNSHPHEEDDEKCFIMLSYFSLFQLTSSRRGWHDRTNKSLFYQHFNSHPHEEDDKKLMVQCYTKNISTHILTKRMTKFCAFSISDDIFQLTSSRRGWLEEYMHGKRNEYFNSHPHEEDDSCGCSILKM